MSAFNARRLSDAAFWSRGYARVPVILGIVGFVLVAWGVTSRHSANARLREYTDAQAVLPVHVVQPKAAEGDLDLVLPGNVQALYEAPIYARTDGYLKRWLVDIGTPVKAGQLLAEIEAPEVDQQLRAAQAELANAQASQRIARSPPIAGAICATRFGLAAGRPTRRSRALPFPTRRAGRAGRTCSVCASFPASRRLSHRSTGVITARNYGRRCADQLGSSEGAELFRIADMSSLRLYVRVPQNYAAATRVGLDAEVRFPDRPGATYHAKLDARPGAIDAASRTLARATRVDNAKGELLPGPYAECTSRCRSQPTRASVRIPANTLLFRGDGLRVATFVDGKVVMKPVTLGRDFGTRSRSSVA
jgi:multidrug efflux pump subunit AcrA (membrane-fusion protein)